jgi:integration host factor subunit alpha
MNKAEIVSRICEKNGISDTDASNIVEATFEIIKASLGRGENVRITHFGNFAVRTKNPRAGRNPRTGEEIVIPKRNVLGFSASPAMKKANVASSA